MIHRICLRATIRRLIELELLRETTAPDAWTQQFGAEYTTLKSGITADYGEGRTRQKSNTQSP